MPQTLLKGTLALFVLLAAFADMLVVSVESFTDRPLDGRAAGVNVENSRSLMISDAKLVVFPLNLVVFDACLTGKFCI